MFLVVCLFAIQSFHFCILLRVLKFIAKTTVIKRKNKTLIATNIYDWKY